MAARRPPRTGIDLGAGGIKLVRGEGTRRLDRITHLGLEEWEALEGEDAVEQAALALRRLLSRLKLRPGRLGRVAVAVKGEQASVREAILPQLSPDELRRALPYEARKHLTLEGISDPVLDCQILGPADATNGDEGPQLRVLLAAVSRQARDFPLQVLQRVGVEPGVVDLEPLACLNALLADLEATEGAGAPAALVDMGKTGTRIHITTPQGKVLIRPAETSANGSDPASPAPEDVDALADRVKATLSFYRVRYREEVRSIHLCGGNAMRPSLAERLESALHLPVVLLNPLQHLTVTAKRSDLGLEDGPRFVAACGLCRWWDGSDV